MKTFLISTALVLGMASVASAETFGFGGAFGFSGAAAAGGSYSAVGSNGSAAHEAEAGATDTSFAAIRLGNSSSYEEEGEEGSINTYNQVKVPFIGTVTYDKTVFSKKFTSEGYEDATIETFADTNGNSYSNVSGETTGSGTGGAIAGGVFGGVAAAAGFNGVESSSYSSSEDN